MLSDLTTLRRRLQASPLDDETALIEAAVLYRSVTAPPPTPRPGSVSRPVGLVELDALTSFDTADAAERFAAAVARGCGVTPYVTCEVRGIRHKHEMHVVRVDEASQHAVRTALSTGWRNAHAGLLSSVPNGAILSGARRTGPTAIAVWRALLLSTTPVRNNAGLRLRLRDADLLSLAVRAAQVLGASTHTRSTAGLGVLCVDDPEQAYRLVENLLPRLPAMRRLAARRVPVQPTPATRPARYATPPGPGRVAAAR